MRVTKEPTKPLSDLFDVISGNKLDFRQMKITTGADVNGVLFVSRSSRNMGIVARVNRYRNINPFPAGTITVALGGSYLLSAFVQEQPFYTAQNVAVLTPKMEMSYEEKLFYCLCLGRNRFKYSAFGREANRTLKLIEVPQSTPEWLRDVGRSPDADMSKPFSTIKVDLQERVWKWFRYDELFTIKKGDRVVNNALIEGSTPLIRPIEFNNGVDSHVTLPPNHSGNTITVSYNGSVAEAFYQAEPHFSVDDINVLYPKIRMNPFVAMFLIPLIRMEQFRYSFGRKWGLKRMRQSVIRLPITTQEEPDCDFMERFIKSLPCSAALAEIPSQS